MFMNYGRQRILLFFGVLFCGLIGLSALSYQLSLNNAANSLETELNNSLPEKIIGAGINDSQHELLNNFLVSRINQDLAFLPMTGRLNNIKYCQAQVQSLYGKTYHSPSSVLRTITVNWSVNEHPHRMSLGLNCQHNWSSLIFSQFILAILSAALLASINKPLHGNNKQLVSILLAHGHSRSDAIALCASTNRCNPTQAQALNIVVAKAPQHTAAILKFLDTGGFKNSNTAQLDWLSYGLQKHPEQFEQAIHICLAPATLSFYLATGHIAIHGVDIKLPSTPFFYYVWYAQQRHQNTDGNEGWFINPPSNRADRSTDSQLINLMQQYGGHYKAINDLEEKGLRAKTLDQNRSKIKDELCQVLGETLATPYLFELERDPQTARFKYRLAIEPSDIVFFEHKCRSASKAATASHT
ncbi:hypothetical protein [Zhongshania aliphaticivorans]|uniref:hypothetical protein n=1 Tax=Zhongshania aliphaticivorans TaxID=1470434 RepID=UPI0012E6466A|nr:hypothetical protein [Zhongshania aliphaticivorans]CAA0090952.1 Uncharacterised protein [Zhongshania aliphaticivorans]